MGLGFDKGLRRFEDCLKHNNVLRHVIRRAIDIYKGARRGVNDALPRHPLKAVALLKASGEFRYPLSFEEALKLFPRARPLKADLSIYIHKTFSKLMEDSELRSRVMPRVLIQLSRIKSLRIH